MWRSPWCMFLLSSLAFSQAAEIADPNPPTAQVQLPSERLRLRHFTYYSELRRGRNEKAALEVAAVVDNFSSMLPAALPLNLELEKNDGFTVTKVEYPKTYEHITPPYAVYNVREANGGSIKFRLRVDRKVGLGKHLLNGRLRVQVVTDKGPSAPQEIEVQIPVTVVEHNAKVTKSWWPYHWDPSNKELILLSPLLVLYVIFGGGGCG